MITGPDPTLSPDNGWDLLLGSPGAPIRSLPRLHDGLVIGVVESGALGLRIRCSAWRPLKAGALFAVGPGTVFQLAVEPDSRLWLLMPDSDELVAFLTRRRSSPASTPIVTSPDITKRLTQALDQGSVDLIGALLAEAAGRHPGWTPARSPEHAEHPAVRAARAFLDDNYHRSVSLDTLASVAGRSPYHLARLFHATVGVPPLAYLRNRRVLRARALLRAGWSASRVGHATGFSDQSHLNRWFKRMFGIPPGEYQRVTRAVERSAGHRYHTGHECGPRES